MRDKNTLFIGVSATETIGLLQDIFGLFVIKFGGGIQCYWKIVVVLFNSTLQIITNGVVLQILSTYALVKIMHFDYELNLVFVISFVML